MLEIYLKIMADPYFWGIVPDMKQPPKSMQHLTIKRIPVKNADTVRYRVYTSADEFVAVIAENALMAMKLTGINEPYKVVRDLISEEGSVPAEVLDREKAELMSLITVPEKKAHTKPDLMQFTNPSVDGFKPLSMGELRKDESILESVLKSPKLIQVLEEAPVAAPVVAQVEVESVAIQPDVEVAPLDMAQQALVEKAAVPAEPLSAKDVVDLLSAKSD